MTNAIITKNSNIRIDNPAFPLSPDFSPLIPLENTLMACVFRNGIETLVDMTKKHTITAVGTPTFRANEWGVVLDGANYLQTSLPYNPTFSFITVARQVQDATLNEEAFIIGNQVGASTTTGLEAGSARGIKIALQGVTGSNLLRTNITIASRRNSDAAYLATNATVDIEDNSDSPRYRTNAVCFHGTNRNITAYEFEGFNPASDLTATTNTTYNDRTFVGSDAQTALVGGNMRIGSSPIQTTTTPNIQVLAVYAYDIQLTAAQVKDQVVRLRDQLRRTETINGTPTVVGATVATGFTPLDLFATVA
jgi:hypothetical protein